ncbi:hypothetical protein TNCV_4740111, partial [Trichonephila clavipes]
FGILRVCQSMLLPHIASSSGLAEMVYAGPVYMFTIDD